MKEQTTDSSHFENLPDLLEVDLGGIYDRNGICSSSDQQIESISKVTPSSDQHIERKWKGHSLNRDILSIEGENNGKGTL
jgi:hypothetical protein